MLHADAHPSSSSYSALQDGGLAEADNGQVVGWWWAAMEMAGTEPGTEPGTAKSQAAPEGSQDMQDRGPQHVRPSRIGFIYRQGLPLMSYTVCVPSSSGMRFAFQAQGKALFHFGCTGAM